jgi:hypothetical protein
MEFDNVTLGAHRIDIRVEDGPIGPIHTLTNQTGNGVDFETVLRIPAGEPVCGVLVNGIAAPFTFDAGVGAVTVSGAMVVGVGAETVVQALLTVVGDLDADRDVDVLDFGVFTAGFGMTSGATYFDGDFDGDGDVDVLDFAVFATGFGSSCP